MKSPDKPPRLRMAPPQTPEQLSMRTDRERRASALQREDALLNSLAPFRVGSVPYLNAAPLTRGIDDQIQFLPPSKLAELLQKNELDAALVSVTEVLYHDRYDVLDGISISSLGEVQSVLLAHRRPLPQVREVVYDPASLTSVNLLKVLLAERGLRPEFKPMTSVEEGKEADFSLWIGDPALELLLNPHKHEIWDLGAAWYEEQRLPFVYAVWALQRGIDHQTLRRRLREAKDFGLDTLDFIVADRTEFSREFRKDYLGWHIHYHLGADEKRGLHRFSELLRKHGFGPVHEPRFVA